MVNAVYFSSVKPTGRLRAGWNPKRTPSGTRSQPGQSSVTTIHAPDRQRSSRGSGALVSAQREQGEPPQGHDQSSGLQHPPCSHILITPPQLTMEIFGHHSFFVISRAQF